MATLIPRRGLAKFTLVFKMDKATTGIQLTKTSTQRRSLGVPNNVSHEMSAGGPGTEKAVRLPCRRPTLKEPFQNLLERSRCSSIDAFLLWGSKRTGLDFQARLTIPAAMLQRTRHARNSRGAKFPKMFLCSRCSARFYCVRRLIFRLLRLLLLKRPHLRKQPTSAHQLRMRPPLHNPPVIHHNNLLRVNHRR